MGRDQEVLPDSYLEEAPAQNLAMQPGLSLHAAHLNNSVDSKRQSNLYISHFVDHNS